MSIKSTMLGLALATTFLTTVEAREAVIGLSPNQSSVTVKSQVQRVMRHLVTTVEPGEEARFFDAANARLIGTFAVPQGNAYKNPRAKLQANRAVLGKLKLFIDGAEAVPGRTAYINLPGFLRALRRNYPTQDGADLIILGSPVFHDAKSPSLSMRGGRVPNNGHIAAHAGQSYFGTKGLPGTLQGYDVYFGDVGADWTVSPSHAYQMERFWTLSVEGHGGSLHYFGSDLETLFGRAGRDEPERKHAEPLVPTDKLEMLQFAPDTAEAPNIYAQPVEQAPVQEPIWRNAKNVQIGITWDCLKCDIDIHVRPNPAAPVIYFNRSTTDEGQLFKDFQNSPTTGFETVALKGRVDLSQVQIAVNFYGGRSERSSVQGEVRIAIGSQVWAQPFKLATRQGNKGAGAETAILNNTAPNAAWVIIDPLKVLEAQ